jgi:hypothetical protein
MRQKIGKAPGEARADEIRSVNCPIERLSSRKKPFTYDLKSFTYGFKTFTYGFIWFFKLFGLSKSPCKSDLYGDLSLDNEVDGDSSAFGSFWSVAVSENYDEKSRNSRRKPDTYEVSVSLYPSAPGLG